MIKLTRGLVIIANCSAVPLSSSCNSGNDGGEGTSTEAGAVADSSGGDSESESDLNAVSERADGLPEEQLVPATCRDCLVIDPSSTYCSLGGILREGELFTTKSRLTVTAGEYGLAGTTGVQDLSFRIESLGRSSELRPSTGAPFVIDPEVEDDAGNLQSFERVRIWAPFTGPGVEFSNFILAAARWPYEQFRLGHAEDIFWWHHVPRRITLEGIQPGGTLFPDVSSPQTVNFAPCSLEGRPDDIFSFEFADGSKVELIFRSYTGVQGLGYKLGRLFSARGTIGDVAIDVQDAWHLTQFWSSRSDSALKVPTMAVRMPESDEGCGYIFDTSQAFSEDATKGYIVYEMTCDQKRGRMIPLASVDFPGRYAIEP